MGFSRLRSTRAFRHSRVGLSTLLSRFRLLILQPVFLAIALVGNFAVVAGAVGFYLLERDINPGLNSLFDAFWWAIATVTTVGYGDVLPITPPGRMIGMAMMLTGTALFCSYTALFASAMLSHELLDVDSEIRLIERRLREISEKGDFDEELLRRTANRLGAVLDRLER